MIIEWSLEDVKVSDSVNSASLFPYESNAKNVPGIFRKLLEHLFMD